MTSRESPAVVSVTQTFRSSKLIIGFQSKTDVVTNANETVADLALIIENDLGRETIQRAFWSLDKLGRDEGHSAQ